MYIQKYIYSKAILILLLETTIIHANIMDQNIDNHSMFRLSYKSRTQKKNPLLVSDLIPSERLTESVHQKVSW